MFTAALNKHQTGSIIRYDDPESASVLALGATMSATLVCLAVAAFFFFGPMHSVDSARKFCIAAAAIEGLTLICSLARRYLCGVQEDKVRFIKSGQVVPLQVLEEVDGHRDDPTPFVTPAVLRNFDAAVRAAEPIHPLEPNQPYEDIVEREEPLVNPHDIAALRRDLCKALPTSSKARS
jgi:hypothetical protein